jgi:hypothetical protein
MRTRTKMAKRTAATTEHNAKSLAQAPGRDATTKELAAIKKFLARNDSVPSVKLKISDGDPRKIQIDYDDEALGQALLLDAMGTGDLDFYNGLISQLSRINSNRGEIDRPRLDFMLSVIKDLKPRDQLEAMLGAQMAAVHTSSMMVAHRLAVSDNIPEQDSTERALNKLTRTYAAQMETLKRYRSGESHTVQNVSVADGGQAVVANVTHSPSENARSEAVRRSPAKANGHANGFVGPMKRVSLRPRLPDSAGPEH